MTEAENAPVPSNPPDVPELARTGRNFADLNKELSEWTWSSPSRSTRSATRCAAS